MNPFVPTLNAVENPGQILFALSHFFLTSKP